MSTALQRQYSLQHAYAVTADSNNSADRVETVAKATAELMHSILHDGDVIGVDCGRTVAHVAPHLSRLPKCDVIQLTGFAGTLTTTAVDLVRRISAITGGTSWPLDAPLAMADARTAGSDGNLRTIPTVIAVTAGPEKIPATRALLRRHRPATPQPPVRRLEQTSVRTVAEMVCGEVPFEAIVMTRTELRRDWQRNRCSCCAAYSS